MCVPQPVLPVPLQYPTSTVKPITTLHITHKVSISDARRPATAAHNLAPQLRSVLTLTQPRSEARFGQEPLVQRFLLLPLRRVCAAGHVVCAGVHKIPTPETPRGARQSPPAGDHHAASPREKMSRFETPRYSRRGRQRERWKWVRKRRGRTR